MGEQGFQVHPEQLEGYGQLIREQVARVEAVRSRLAAVPLVSRDFGKLPDADELYEAYREHAQAEEQNFGDLAELLDGAGEALQSVAGNYRDLDHEIAAGLGGHR
ncbi:WXG100 family type VII secretion target [Kitasatospora sp. NPDC059673]|uniref:WXG100 family type VII secretion target n=1 Tax=Kitasatospora sp. NPDC059673 TaxID=3346901 RepID=UPI0036C7F694